MSLGQPPCLPTSSQPQAEADSVILICLLIRKETTPDSRITGGKETQACFPTHFPPSSRHPIKSHCKSCRKSLSLSQRMDVPPARVWACRVTLPLDQLDTMTTAGLQQDTEKKAPRSLLSLCTCLADTFPKCSCVTQLAEQRHLSGYQQQEVLLLHISHKEQLLPPSHCSQGQRRQHGPHRGNKVPVRQLRARTCSQAGMEAHVLRPCSRTRW